MEAVERAFRALDEGIADYLARKGIRPSCGPGCFACCYGWVTASRLEAQALLPHLTEAQKARILEEGPRRLALLAREKDDPGFPRRFFLSRSPCPLLEAGLCGVYAHRPLACRGVLTDEDPAYCDPENPHPAPKPHHGPGHFLRVPHRMARRRMEELWEEERAQTGFLVLGELSGLLYLLLTGLPEDREGVEARLEALGVLGGRFGFQVV
ncbi:YkgJ family cysteine cluster protein [Thermus thermophilus]|uniref:YkgJ family cysteine cluster protein n=1 Tax=Thermus thermophilus TaxID=274 RepID=UPI001FCCABA7|nr:YkgJ family cysteine cluster protein [Thermus thermophilus]BDG28284.1 hypothetical protein TthSNM76_04940 [Thermus thermophilus]